MNKTLTVNLLPHQMELVNAKERECLVSGAWGAAKTSALCYSILKEATIPNTTILLCRKTYTSLRRTTLVSLLYGQNPILPKGSYVYNKQEQCITLNGLNSKIYLTGLEDFLKIRSMNLSMVAVDECCELNEEEWMELLGRLRSEYGSRRIIGATNPSTPSHFLYKRFFIDKSKNRKLIKARMLDNPYLPKDYVESLKESLSQEMYNRFVLGEWIALEKAIYKEWNRSKIVRKTYGDFAKYLVGIDFGFTNPCAIGLFGVDGDNNIHLIEEQYETGLRIGQIVERCQKYHKLEPTVVVDPSAPALIAELQNEGFNATKADNDIDSGIARIQNALHNNKFTIDGSCEQFISEIENYSFDDKGKPVKINDHLMDLTRYVFNHLETTTGNHNPIFVFGSSDIEDIDNEGQNGIISMAVSL